MHWILHEILGEKKVQPQNKFTRIFGAFATKFGSIRLKVEHEQVHSMCPGGPSPRRYLRTIIKIINRGLTALFDVPHTFLIVYDALLLSYDPAVGRIYTIQGLARHFFFFFSRNILSFFFLEIFQRFPMTNVRTFVPPLMLLHRRSTTISLTCPQNSVNLLIVSREIQHYRPKN